MRERLDFLFAQGISDVGHRCHPATRAFAGFEVIQRFDEIVLALSGDPRHGLGAGERVGVA